MDCSPRKDLQQTEHHISDSGGCGEREQVNNTEGGVCNFEPKEYGVEDCGNCEQPSNLTKLLLSILEVINLAAVILVEDKFGNILRFLYYF